MSQVAYLIFPDHVGIRPPRPPRHPRPSRPCQTSQTSPPPLFFALVGLVLTVHMFIAPHKLYHSKKLLIWCHCCSLLCNTTYFLKDSKNLLFFCPFFFTSDSLVDGVCAADWWLLPRPTHLRPVSDMVKMQHAVLRPWILNGCWPLPSEPASSWGNKWSVDTESQPEREGQREAEGKERNWTIEEAEGRREREETPFCPGLYRTQSVDGLAPNSRTSKLGIYIYRAIKKISQREVLLTAGSPGSHLEAFTWSKRWEKVIVRKWCAIPVVCERKWMCVCSNSLHSNIHT